MTGAWRMPLAHFFFHVVLLHQFKLVSSSVTVTNSDGTKSTGQSTWESSTFVYFGPSNPTVTAPAVYLNAEESCCYEYETCDRGVWRDQVVGKIVVVNVHAACIL